MKIGDGIRLKTGELATITAIGFSDFIGEPYPVYLKTNLGASVMLMSNELKKRPTTGEKDGV